MHFAICIPYTDHNNLALGSRGGFFLEEGGGGGKIAREARETFFAPPWRSRGGKNRRGGQTLSHSFTEETPAYRGKIMHKILALSIHFQGGEAEFRGGWQLQSLWGGGLPFCPPY